ncbi:pfs domain-containing protein [Histoplasma ohiense]|nr:pfs domain-containing protein [Histoplasma ohiense (nom. inval.)]
MTSLDSPNEYTVGWICALPLERAPAEEMLEEKHASPKGFKQPRTDNNVYTLGRIGGHNIVIASLPAGKYGTSPATGVAMAMLSTFPEIRFGLMVGIGAAIPRGDRDIRLGDVAVSSPDGKSGGVVQYDLGKALKGDKFERKGSLNSPPDLLLNAVSMIQTEHRKTDSKIPMYLGEMLKRLPSMAKPRDGTAAYIHQGLKNDRLFEATYDHQGGNDCSKCDQSKILQHESRDPDKPRIHYGVIASGNTLIKSGSAREKLLKNSEEECICFEMEAAGLMDKFPCLVIRGLCDYADSHKNDQWQPYAAATAAGYARELLQYLPVQDVGKVPTANETLNRNSDTSSKPPQANKLGAGAGSSAPSGGSDNRNPAGGNGTSNPTTTPETDSSPNGRGEGGSQTNNKNTMRVDSIYDGRWQHQWRLIWAGQHIQEINPNFASTQRISEIHLTTFTHSTWASCIVEVDVFHASQRVQGIPEVPTVCTQANDESVSVAKPFYQQVSTKAVTAGKELENGNRTWNRGAYFQPLVANSDKFKFIGRRVMCCQGKSEEGGLNLAPLNSSDYCWRLKDLNLDMGQGHRIYAVIRAYSLWEQFAFRALVNVSMFP